MIKFSFKYLMCLVMKIHNYYQNGSLTTSLVNLQRAQQDDLERGKSAYQDNKFMQGYFHVSGVD